MDYLRVLLVPFRPTALVMVGVFTAVIAFLLWAVSFMQLMGFWGLIAVFLMNTWVLKYCFVLIEQIADGATEPPVMDADMLSPFETRPLTQTIVLIAGATLCWKVGGQSAAVIASLFLLAFPAQVALVAMGDNAFRALNPLSWLRVIRGLGPFYAMLLAALVLFAGINWAAGKVFDSNIIRVAIFLMSEVGFFGLIGSSIWLRRRQLGFEPSRSPERTEAKLESERLKQRAKMMDEVFENSRIGKHVDATAPLARWLRDLDAEYAARDALYAAEQSLKWQIPLALNPIGSTLIRHLLRFGRPDAALAIYEMFRKRSPQFTMDSAADLRILAEYAEGVGKDELATSMRLETPVVHPPT
ncbi:MAG TPA: hypothetical protein VM146_01030 [Steroidobacteraceae bacterium]|nr:hypothetical protein [Steroidobacteraceae bacterium]